MIRLCAFSDEAGSSLQAQIDALHRNGMSLMEIRMVDGENISKISLEKAAEIAKTLKENDVILMFGDLGAGKTCFTNGILYGLDFLEGGSSPTFTIVNEYPTTPKINHFDLYRLQS